MKNQRILTEAEQKIELDKVLDLRETLQQYQLQLTHEGIKKLLQLDPSRKRLADLGLKAKDLLIWSNVGLIYRLAKNFSHLSKEEALNVGVLGILHAIKKYNRAKEIKFSSYAFFWIRHYLQETLNHKPPITIPNRTQTKLNNIEKLPPDQQQRLGKFCYYFESWENYSDLEYPATERADYSQDPLQKVFDVCSESEKNFLIDYFELATDSRPLFSVLSLPDFKKLGWRGIDIFLKELAERCQN